MQLRAAIKVPSNTGERSPACLRIHGVQVNEGHKETLLAAGRGREAAAPTAKSSQCLTGPLPEGVAGMISGMLSWVSPPRIHSAPHKIPRLYPSQGSLPLQTPELFRERITPKRPTVLPSPALPIQPVFTAAPFFVIMFWACHPYCPWGPHKPPLLRRAPPLLQPE